MRPSQGALRPTELREARGVWLQFSAEHRRFCPFVNGTLMRLPSLHGIPPNNRYSACRRSHGNHGPMRCRLLFPTVLPESFRKTNPFPGADIGGKSKATECESETPFLVSYVRVPGSRSYRPFPTTVAGAAADPMPCPDCS